MTLPISRAGFERRLLHPLVSPWIRAALVRDAGWLGLRGQRDARSNARKSPLNAFSCCAQQLRGVEVEP